MKIHFFYKATGEAIPYPDGCLFVMNDKVFCDNQNFFETQEETVHVKGIAMFDDFIVDHPEIGWRVLAPGQLPTATPSNIAEWVDRIEAISGVFCSVLRELPADSTVEQIEAAYQNEIMLFKGMADQIKELC